MLGYFIAGHSDFAVYILIQFLKRNISFMGVDNYCSCSMIYFRQNKTNADNETAHIIFVELLVDTFPQSLRGDDV